MGIDWSRPQVRQAWIGVHRPAHHADERRPTSRTGLYGRDRQEESKRDESTQIDDNIDGVNSRKPIDTGVENPRLDKSCLAWKLQVDPIRGPIHSPSTRVLREGIVWAEMGTLWVLARVRQLTSRERSSFDNPFLAQLSSCLIYLCFRALIPARIRAPTMEWGLQHPSEEVRP